MGRFVAASEEIRFESKNREQVYGWLERVLVEQEYARQGKAARGLDIAPHQARRTRP